MTPTSQIREALLTTILGTELFEKVIPFSEVDLGAALEHIRDSPDSLCVIVPGDDEFRHQLVDGLNIPERSETRNRFELIITARELDMREDGAPAAVDLKDSLTSQLLWHELSIPELITLPLTAEPMIVEIDDARGREAWKITLETRQQIHG